jgi:hypothetical protein
VGSQDLGNVASVVGLASKGAGLAGIGAGTALEAAIPVVGWAAAAVSIAAALFGGGGSTPSVLQGFRVNGAVDSSGFNGKITAFDQLGNTWDASGEGAYLNGLGAELYDGNNFANPAPRSDIEDFFTRHGPQGLNITLGVDNTQIPGAVSTVVGRTVNTILAQDRAQDSANSLLAQLQAANTAPAPTLAAAPAPEVTTTTTAAATGKMEAPTLTNDMPAPIIPGAGVTVAPPAGPLPSSGAAAAQTNAAAAASPMMAITPAWLALLAGAAWFIWKG